jgi:hypothetical protein
MLYKTHDLTSTITCVKLQQCYVWIAPAMDFSDNHTHIHSLQLKYSRAPVHIDSVPTVHRSP